MKKKFFIILSAFLSTNSFAQTLADAHKAYVAGNWEDAAKAYEVACPKEPDSLRAECYLWDILALSQTGATKLFKMAGHRLDSLINTTSPERPVYSEMLLTKAQFMLYMGKNARAAEILIQAIDHSKLQQAVVLQKNVRPSRIPVSTAPLKKIFRRRPHLPPWSSLPQPQKPKQSRSLNLNRNPPQNLLHSLAPSRQQNQKSIFRTTLPTGHYSWEPSVSKQMQNS